MTGLIAVWICLPLIRLTAIQANLKNTGKTIGKVRNRNKKMKKV
jgi:hypothetical protein